MMQKKITVLGSTGSIGEQTLRVAKHLQIPVVALAAGRNIERLEQQIAEFQPSLVAVYDSKEALRLQKKIPSIEVVGGEEGVIAVAEHPEANLVMSAITGSAGIAPTLAAIQSGKTIALANKEVLVAAGELILQKAKEKGVDVLPVDSEHSALFQCLAGLSKKDVRRMILTASGGPFFRYPLDSLKAITSESALAHPTWKMGPKVTIDSSTLMNKGLEVIEAYHLFQIPLNAIEVVIHPQSIVHSMVETVDGSILAQMSEPNMMFPIQYALTYPERKTTCLSPFPWDKMQTLEFFPLEKGKFRCLELAYAALKAGGTVPCYLNAANEVLVSRFLKKEIGWIDIGQKLETLLARYVPDHSMTLEAIYAVDAKARDDAKQI